MHARGFLVAWGGVLALAFCDWPPLLKQLKACLNEMEGAAEGGVLDHLARENAGSRWPKITLGALRPGVTLTLSDLTNLRNVTGELSRRLEEQHNSPWEIAKIHVAAYTSRSLEQRVCDEAVALPASRSCDAHEREAPRSGLVEEVMREWEEGDLQRYLERVNTGTSALHYTEKISLDYVSIESYGCALVRE